MTIPWLALIILGIGVFLIFITATSDRAAHLVNLVEVRRSGTQNRRKVSAVIALLSNRTRWAAMIMLLNTLGAIIIIFGVMQIGFADTSTLWLVFIALATWFIVSAVQVMGEAVAVRNPLACLLRFSPFLMTAFWLLHPLTATLNRIFQRVAGEASPGEEDILFSDDRVKVVISSHGDQSEIEESEKEMIASILEMNETVAREIMAPRIDISAVDVEEGITEALEKIISAGHSRLPVYENDIDHIIGLLYAKDLLQCLSQNRPDTPIRQILRPAYFVPASKDVKSLFAEMRKHRVHMAIIVDEYGGTAGLVTIEDILEEIVGEIQDEYDQAEAALVQNLDAGGYLINARIDIAALSKLLDVDFEDEDADTLGGLILSVLGHVPQKGENVEILGWRFTVVSVDGRRVEQARAERLQLPDAGEMQIADREQAAVLPNAAVLVAHDG